MENITLLVDGKNAFPDLLSCIENARKSIDINMFIWRQDSIGCQMAVAVLRAAERGVKVRISVDRYAYLLERAEERRLSFFHRFPTLSERIKMGALHKFYGKTRPPEEGERCELAQALLSHPNVTVEKDTVKADHSKYYVFDEEILFLGGVNIEDKENGCDEQGRTYQDYMARLDGAEHVARFRAYMRTGESLKDGYFFGANVKEPRRFEMERLYLETIDGAKERLDIVMAYFSPLKKFRRAILNAYKRGVAVNVMIPAQANFQSDTNRKTLRRLMKASKNGIGAYLSPKMLHTKLIVNDSLITFGSTNITKKAFRQLSELNLFVENGRNEFCEKLFESMEENYALAQKITHYKQIKYRAFTAFIESFLV